MTVTRDIATTIDDGSLPQDPNPTRLEILHACFLTLGVALGLAGFFASGPRLFLIAGPCLVASAALRWFSIQIRLSGALGRVLRRSLGASQLISLRLRVLTWLVMGVVLTAWGLTKLARQAERQPFQPPTELSLSHQSVPTACSRGRPS